MKNNKLIIIICSILLIGLIASGVYYYNNIKCNKYNGDNCMGKPTKCEEAYKCELKQEQTYSCHYCDGELNDDFVCNGKEEIIECKTNY